MMEWIFGNMLFMPLLIGAVFVIAAGITYLFPPKKINYLYGYRTERSMLSQQRWDFAQKYSSKKMFQSGVVLLALSFCGLFIDVDEDLNFFIGIIPSVLSCVFILYTTEKALRQNFPNT